MPKNPTRSRELRRFARDFLDGFARDEFVPESEREDLSGSLVRQWLTYDKNAVLLLGEQTFYLELETTPLGRWRVNVARGRSKWDALTSDWKIDPAEIPNVMARLNLAQSVQVTNLDGAVLRVWVDPKKRSGGVESLVEGPLPPRPLKRDYHRIAGDALEAQLGNSVAADEMEALTQSVAAQLQRHQGHACIFLNTEEQLAITLSEQSGGGCNRTTRREKIDLKPLFASLGFAPDVVPEVIGRLNLGQQIEFRDLRGIPSVMWQDPEAKLIRVRARGMPGPGPQQAAS